MPSFLDFLAFRQIGFHKSKKYVDGKKVVLDLLEFEAAKPTQNQPCNFSGEPRATFLVDFSPNMLLVASTHGDHSVRVTNIESGKCTHVLTGHPRTPWCLAFNPTSNDILASGCLGGEVRIWDLLGGGSEVLHNPSLGAVITSLAFHPSGQVLVFATMNCIYFWDWSKPCPFAVTKTTHEYERIRWLRFDPFGKYLYTGIANNTTLYQDRARHVIGIGQTGSESREDLHSRSLLLRNRYRYNQLMQRFRSFQESQRYQYPESVRPRSPVHEENLSLARHYASHVTERAGALGLNTRYNPSQRIPESNLRTGIVRDSSLARGQTNHGNRSSQSAVDAEGERFINSRGWGRYQPLFFTPSTAGTNESNNTNASAADFHDNSRPHYVRPARAQGENRYSASRMAPYSVREPSRLSRLSRMRYAFDASSSQTPSSTDDIAAGHHPEELEPDEFEILPVDQNQSRTEHVSGSEEGSELDGMSASDMAQRLEQQLRQLRRELFRLTQRNVDTNSASTTLPSQGLSQSFLRTDAESSESSSLPRSSFRSAGSALSRSIFSRSGSNSASTAFSASSSSSSSSILSSALSGMSSSSISAVSRPTSVSSNSIAISRSTPSTSNVPYISFVSSSGVTRISSSSISSSLSTNLATLTSSVGESIPTTVIDNTSQTFGAMNLPEQLDRSTDIAGLESGQWSGDVSGPEGNERECIVTYPKASRHACDTCNSLNDDISSNVDLTSNLGLESGLSNIGCGSTSSLTQQPSCGLISTSAAATTAQTQLTTIPSLCATSTLCSVPSLGRNTLTASSSSLLFTPSSSSSSSLSSASVHATNRALNTSSNNTTNESTIGGSSGLTSSTSLSSRPSALNDRRVFRSLSNLRESLSNVMSEERLRSQVVIYNGERIPLNSVVHQSDDSSSERRWEILSSEVPSVNSASTSSEIDSSETLTFAERCQLINTLRASVASIQRRLSEVLHNMRSNQEQNGDLNEEAEHLRDVEHDISETSSVLSHTTTYWTDVLGRHVMELEQRILDLERRLEANQYLLSSNPFSIHRPGRPQDALMSSLFRNRTGPGNNASQSSEAAEPRSSTSRGNDPPPTAPSTTGSSARINAANIRQAARGQIQRNQLLLDFLVWRDSRDSQSQRSLSFGQSVPNAQSSASSSSSSAPSTTSSAPSTSSSAPSTTSSAPSTTSSAPSTTSSVSSTSSASSTVPITLQAPILSSTLTAALRSPLSSSTLPLSVTIHPSRDEESEEEEDDNEEEEGMMRDRLEQGNRRGRRRRARAGEDNEGGGGDSSWLNLRNINLHPDYSSSILDDTVNRPNETVQHIMSRTIAAVMERDEQAVANNIKPQTHRIQRWKISDVIVPCIAKATANVIVEQCKLHNDASCDISKDGTTLATFVPSHRGFPDDNILGVFSLRKETFGQCLYTKSFGPNAISVSISPANHYVMVGLAARRYFLFSLSNKMVCQVYKLVKEKAGEKSMQHITDLFHPRARGVQLHISVNFGRWLPGIGEGIVYGTNRGDLHFCRPGSRRVPEILDSDSKSHPTASSRRSGSVRSSIATQTITVSIRRTASTQTQGVENEAGPSR